METHPYSAHAQDVADIMEALAILERTWVFDKPAVNGSEVRVQLIGHARNNM